VTPKDTTESDRFALAGQVVSAHTAFADPAIRVALALTALACHALRGEKARDAADHLGNTDDHVVRGV
jgi:hypothetical protein